MKKKNYEQKVSDQYEFNKFGTKSIESSSWSLLETMYTFSETTNMIKKCRIEKS